MYTEKKQRFVERHRGSSVLRNSETVKQKLGFQTHEAEFVRLSPVPELGNLNELDNQLDVCFDQKWHELCDFRLQGEAQTLIIAMWLEMLELFDSLTESWPQLKTL